MHPGTNAVMQYPYSVANRDRLMGNQSFVHKAHIMLYKDRNVNILFSDPRPHSLQTSQPRSAVQRRKFISYILTAPLFLVPESTIPAPVRTHGTRLRPRTGIRLV